MRFHDYGPDILAGKKQKPIPEVAAETGLVVEDVGSDFCGAIVTVESTTVTLEDRRGNRRLFPLSGTFLLDGNQVTLVRPRTPTDTKPAQSASGSIKVTGLRARIARNSRIWVEGIHDAELIERVWGHDLRVEGIVVEPIDGIHTLPERITAFGPTPDRKLGILVDHLVHDSKESRLTATIHDDNVLVTGHPYIDIWQAVRPHSMGITAWPEVPRHLDWKEGVCQALGWADPLDGWHRVSAGVHDFRDVETPLITAVEQLIDFVAQSS